MAREKRKYVVAVDRDDAPIFGQNGGGHQPRITGLTLTEARSEITKPWIIIGVGKQTLYEIVPVDENGKRRRRGK